MTKFQRYYKKNKEKRKAQFHAYYKRNETACKMRAKEYNERMKAGVFEILGKNCRWCGFDDMRALQIDHVNGGGRIEKSKLTINYYKHVLAKLLAGDNGYQVLCANCNWIKRAERGEHRK